jgi:hypothetical protein
MLVMNGLPESVVADGTSTAAFQYIHAPEIDIY